MSLSSQQASDFEKSLQELDRETTRRDYQHSVSNQSGATLVPDRHGRVCPARPSTTASSLKRRREGDEQTARFPAQNPKRRMLNPSTRASRGRNQLITNAMEIDDAEPQSPSRDHNVEDVSLETKQSAETSTTHQRSSWAEMRRGELPDHTSYTSNSEDTEIGGIIDEDAGEPEAPIAVEAEGDELASVFKTLTVGLGSGFSDSGDQPDGDGKFCVPVYPVDIEIELL